MTKIVIKSIITYSTLYFGALFINLSICNKTISSYALLFRQNKCKLIVA